MVVLIRNWYNHCLNKTEHLNKEIDRKNNINSLKKQTGKPLLIDHLKVPHNKNNDKSNTK